MADLDELLEHLRKSPDARPHGLVREREIVVARAPGRLDLMGGIADYSGSLTLELPTREATWALVQEGTDGWVRITSLDATGRRPPRSVQLAAPELVENAVSLPSARAYFAALPERWPAYVAGTLSLLWHESGVRLERGPTIVVASDVPEGMGVSSSAAVEVATLKALASLFQREMSAFDLALACQRVENRIVGAPCGVMDQMTSSAGKEGHVLELLCQPATIQGWRRIPAPLAVWGIDSGIRHAVSGADYGDVRVAAFMGYRIIAERLGLAVEPGPPGQVTIRDGRLGGYLANLTPAELEGGLARALPEQLGGAEFLARYGGITDPVTRVAPERTYRVRAATVHPVYEHQRVQELRDGLHEAVTPDVAERMGQRMYEAHASYSACGLGSSGTDLLVELARERGVERGVYGAKITGGGSGGTVALLTRADARDEVFALARAYAARTGHDPHVFWGSSPGAQELGVRRVSLGADGEWHVAPPEDHE